MRAYALASTPYAVVTFLLPEYILRLGGGLPHVGAAYAAYAVATVLVRPAAGRLADGRGRRPLMALGVSLLSTSLALLALATSPPAAVGAMLAVGAASGLVNVAAAAHVADVGGLERPELYARLRASAVAGAVAGAGAVVPAYLLHRQLGYLAAFRLVVLALAAAVLLALAFLPPETRHLASRHVVADARPGRCVLALSLALGTAAGLYSPMVIPALQGRYGLSPFAAMLLYSPAVVSWGLGPRLARPSPRSVAAGAALAAAALAGMELASNPLTFTAMWLLEGLGISVAGTSVDQLVARAHGGMVWGRAYGLAQGAYNLGYFASALASGFLPTPFASASLALATGVTAVLGICRGASGGPPPLARAL